MVKSKNLLINKSSLFFANKFLSAHELGEGGISMNREDIPNKQSFYFNLSSYTCSFHSDTECAMHVHQWQVYGIMYCKFFLIVWGINIERNIPCGLLNLAFICLTVNYLKLQQKCVTSDFIFNCLNLIQKGGYNRGMSWNKSTHVKQGMYSSSYNYLQ